MPAFKYYWVNKKKFGLYSKAAAGMMFLNYKDKDKELNKTLTDNDVLFMFQVSLIGAEIGSQNLRGFAELGGGESGFHLTHAHPHGLVGNGQNCHERES